MEAVHTALRQCTGLDSLRLQNHIYGCFLVMEDIASGTLRWQEGILQGKDFTIDFERDFAWLGIRYGFFMDRGLALQDIQTEYRAAWKARLMEIAEMESGAAHAAADVTEDELLVTLRELPDPFFVRALETGSLPQSLISRVLLLLEGREEPAPDSRLTHAIPEKPLRQRILSHTFRHHDRAADPRIRVRFTRRAHATRK